LAVDFKKFNLEMLQSLASIAPNSDEMSALEAFAGKRTHLAEGQMRNCSFPFLEVRNV
jgi:hypothetical protein